MCYTLNCVGTSPLLPCKPPPVNTSNAKSDPHPPTSSPSSIAAFPENSLPHDHHTPHHCPVPPHRHTLCDIVPCTYHHDPAVPHERSRCRGRERRKREGESKNRREREEGEERERFDEVVPEPRIPFSEPPLPREDNVGSVVERNGGQHASSSAPPPVRYPSPSLLNHMRHPQQSRDNHLDQSPWEREEENELSTTASETFLSTTAPSTPNHHHSTSLPGSVGRLLTQVGSNSLYDPRNPSREKLPRPCDCSGHGKIHSFGSCCSLQHISTTPNPLYAP